MQVGEYGWPWWMGYRLKIEMVDGYTAKAMCG